MKVSIALATLLVLLAAGCATTVPASLPTETLSTTTTIAPGGTPASSTAAIVGTWHRAQSCQEMLTAFQKAGLAEGHADAITGNFFGGGPAPTTGDICAGANGPLEHSHFFTADGAFGSRDENGQRVDDGDYTIVDATTLSFPSHAREFKYSGQILVHFAISGNVVTFTIVLPQPCDESCGNAYAWALSAFASGPWTRSGP